MSCVKNRKPLLAGLTSVSSMIGFILMPKCPLCLAIGLSAMVSQACHFDRLQSCLWRWLWLRRSQFDSSRPVHWFRWEQAY
jgi:hypothetical protein